MNDRAKTKEQLSHLDDYNLFLVYEASLCLLKKRGVNLSLNIQPSNIKNIKGSPKYLRPKKFDGHRKEFENLISQDWNYLFCGEYDSEEKYYVYIHYDPRFIDGPATRPNHLNGTPFYVGKGTGSRYSSKTRSKPHRDLIKEISGFGFCMDDIAKIYKDGLSERDALILESKLITYYGCRSELGRLNSAYMNGLKRGLLMNSDTGVRPIEISAYIETLKSKK